MHYLLSIYLNNQPLHVSSRLTAYRQEVLLCWQDRNGSCQQPVNINA